jgi:hypothetical protein
MYGGNSVEIFNNFFTIAHFNDMSYDLDGTDMYPTLAGDAHKGKS